MSGPGDLFWFRFLSALSICFSVISQFISFSLMFLSHRNTGTSSVSSLVKTEVKNSFNTLHLSKSVLAVFPCFTVFLQWRPNNKITGTVATSYSLTLKVKQSIVTA